MTTDYTSDDMKVIMTKVASAFIGLRDGSNSIADFNLLASAINIGAIRAESMTAAEVEVFSNAKVAMMEVDAIYETMRFYSFSQAQLVDVAKAVQGYSDLLKTSTPAQMEAAGDESERRKAAGFLLKHPTKH